MKRAGLLVLWTTVIGLAACDGRAPTAPGETRVTPTSQTPAQGAGKIRPFSDDDDDNPSLSVSISANPTTIQPGQSSTLTWTSRNATAVYLDDERVPSSGSKTVTPSSTKEYEIEATNGDKKVEAEVK